MKFGKRIFIFLALTVIAFTVGCGDDSTEPSIDDGNKPEGVITLTFWNGFTGADGASMKKIVNEFNQEYEGEIFIKLETYTWDTLFMKLFTTTTNAKFLPHIVAMGANRLAGVKEKNILMPINDVMEKLQLTRDDFIPAAYDAGIFGSERYSFPLDIHPTAIYYNKELISEEDLPKTWDEFYSVCKELTKDGVYGWAIPNQYSITKDIFLSMLYQQGGDIFNDKNDITLNTEKARNILTQLETWKYTDKISSASVGNGGDYTLFQSGKSVFYFDGPWTMNAMDADDGLNFEYGVLEMPGSTGENGTSFAGSHQLTLVKKTCDKSYIVDACYTFINYLSEHALEWAKAGQVPARKSVLETSEFKALTKLQPFYNAALKASIGNVSYKYFYEAYNHMGSAVAAALNTSENDASKQLAKYETNFNRFLAEEE